MTPSDSKTTQKKTSEMYGFPAEEWLVSWVGEKSGEKRTVNVFGYLTAMHFANNLKNARLVTWKRKP